MPGQIKAKPKVLLFVGAAAGAALLAVWAAEGAPGFLPTLASAKRQPASVNPRSAPNFGTRAYRPEAGQRYVYTFQRKITFSGSLEIPPVAYSGEFYLDVLRADSRVFEALVSESVKQAGGKISPPLRIEASSRGDNLALFTSATASEEEKEHAAVIKDLVSLWLFPLRADTVGPYEARFEEMEPEKEFSFERKIKLSYRDIGPNTPAVLNSVHLLRWSEALALPDSVEGQETTRLGGGAGALTAESRYRIRFHARGASPAVDPAILTALRENVNLQLDAAGNASLAEHPDYKNLDWGKMLSQLPELARLSGSEQLAAFGDLVRYLRLHPEKASDLAALLRDPALLRQGSSSPVFRTIVGTLATSGSAEALAILREAFVDPALATDGKNTILAALTTTQAPLDVATREFLTDVMRSNSQPHLAQGAAFALGSALQSAGQDSQAQSAIQMIQEAWQAQAQSNQVPEQLALLDVMGNSGRPEFYPTLQKVIQGENSAQLRARAVFALRFMHDDASAQTLLVSLDDREAPVREAAVNAMEVTWNEKYRAPLARCAQAETETRIQESCRKVLENNPYMASAE